MSDIGMSAERKNKERERTGGDERRAKKRFA